MIRNLITAAAVISATALTACAAPAPLNCPAADYAITTSTIRGPLSNHTWPITITITDPAGGSRAVAYETLDDQGKIRAAATVTTHGGAASAKWNIGEYVTSLKLRTEVDSVDGCDTTDGYIR